MQAEIHPPSPKLCFSRLLCFLHIWRKKADKIIAIQTGDKVLCRKKEPQVIWATFRSNQCSFIFTHRKLFGGLCFGNVSSTAQGRLFRKGQPGALPESAVCLLLKNNMEIFKWPTLKKKWLVFYNVDLEMFTIKNDVLWTIGLGWISTFACKTGQHHIQS